MKRLMVDDPGGCAVSIVVSTVTISPGLDPALQHWAGCGIIQMCVGVC
jgi:hypothetical protein